MTLLVAGSGDEFRIAVMRSPKNYFKDVYRVEIRLASVADVQPDPALGRDDPHNGSNVYVFSREAVVQHKAERAFFAALDRDGKLWWSVPLDLSMIEKGEEAMSLADTKLATMRADFTKRCTHHSKVDGLVIA